MENYLNNANFNSSEGVTFGEYPTSSKTQDSLGDIQTSSQFNQQFIGDTNILSSSTETSALQSLSGNIGDAQYSSLNETLPFINAVNDYETLGTNKAEVSSGQCQYMNENITNITDIANNTQMLPEEYSSLMTQNINSNDQFQNMDIIPSSSSSEVLNTFQSSNYNNEISLGNFQTPTAEINSNNFGEVDNILQGANQGEMINLPTEYSAETNKNQAFEFNDFKTASASEPGTSLQFQTTDTNMATNYLNSGISTNGFETQSSNLLKGNCDILALSSGVTTNDIGFDTQTNLNVDTGAPLDVNNLGNFDNYQTNSSTTDTGMPLNDYQNINIETNTTTSGFDTVENAQNNINFQATENYETFNDTNNLSLNAFQIKQNNTELNPSFNLNELQTNSETTSYQAAQPTMESNSTFDLNAMQTSTNIDTFSNAQNYDSNMLQSSKPINEITPSFDLNALQTTSTVDNSSLPQTFENNAFQAEQYDLNALQATGTVSNTQSYDFKDYQASTPSFDLNGLQTTETINSQSYDIKDYQTSTPSFDLNAIQTSSTIDNIQTYDNKDYQISVPSVDLNTQNISNNLLDYSNQFQATSDNISSLNLYSSPQTKDINTYQENVQLTPSLDLNIPQSTQFTDIASTTPISTSFSTLEPATSFNFNNLENVATVDTSSNSQILDTGAIQAICPTIDTTPSFDLNNLQINTTPIVNTASTFESVPKLSNYTPFIDSNSAFKSFDTTNFQNTQVSEINPSYNFYNQASITEPNLNISALSSTAQITPMIDTNIVNTTSTNFDGFVTNIPSSIAPNQTDNVTFSEYRTTTNVGGVRSEYMPQIEPNLNTSFQQTPAALPIYSSQILPAKSVILPSTYVKRRESSMDLSIPKVSVPKLNISSSMMIPSVVSGPIITPREFSPSRVVPITFSPSQSELIRSQSFINSPLKSPIINKSRVFSPGKKLYSNPTYRAYLNRKEKIHQNRHKQKSQNTAKVGRLLYKPKYYNKFD